MCKCKKPYIIKAVDSHRGKTTHCGKCGKDLQTAVQQILLQNYGR